MQATKTAVKYHNRQMPHILVVDDERSICELLEITFRKEGYRIEVAHNVEAAKRKLESQIFDIVISDVRMPGESGVDLLQLTKEIAPECFFLLITGVPTVETAIAAINAGADRYVIKDHELVDQLRRAVREEAPAPAAQPVPVEKPKVPTATVNADTDLYDKPSDQGGHIIGQLNSGQVVNVQEACTAKAWCTLTQPAGAAWGRDLTNN